MMKLFSRGLAIAAAVVALDQLTKFAVQRLFSGDGCLLRHPAGGQFPVTPFFDVVLTCNRGMSFGLFNNGAGLNPLAFSALALAIVAMLLLWLRRVGTPLLAVAIGMIIGGALGNVVDRLRYGAVVDFLYFHLGALGYPAFNLGDSAICLGVAAMLFDGLLLHREAH